MKSIKGKSFKEIIKYIDFHFGFGRMEICLAQNWFNPLYTFWLNFRSFPLRQAVCLPIFVYGRPRLYCLTGDMYVEGPIRPGMITFNQCKYGAPSLMSVQSEMVNQGSIIFRGSGLIGTGTKIRVASKGTLTIGNDFKIADMSNVGCFSQVVIGEHTRIAHRCQILDSNYHYIANFNKRVIPKRTNPIAIGSGCWICNSTTVTGGAVIPDYTIVTSNSLVNKDFSQIEQGSLIGGIPAKYIASGFRRVENRKIEHRVNIFYAQRNASLYPIPEDVTEDLISSVGGEKNEE